MLIPGAERNAGLLGLMAETIDVLANLPAGDPAFMMPAGFQIQYAAMITDEQATHRLGAIRCLASDSLCTILCLVRRKYPPPFKLVWLDESQDRVIKSARERF